MKINEIQKCIELCRKLIDGKYSISVKWVILQYWTFFERHQLIVDGMALNRFWEIGDKVVEGFLEWERWMKEDVGHEPTPILIESEVPREVRKALVILNDAMTKALEKTKLLYYNLSLKIPSDALYRWMNPIQFHVVGSDEEATRLAIESRIRLEIEERELAKEKKKIEKTSQNIEEPKEKPRQPNPFASDGFGTLWGSEEEGIKPPHGRVKIY